MNALMPHLDKKTHVIWDWNGTLLCDIEHAVQTVNRLLVEENLKPTTIDQYKKIFGFPVIDYYKRLGFNTAPEPFHELCVRFNKYFYEGLGRCEMWPGAREVLTAVHRSRKIQSLLSASEHGQLLNSIRHFDLECLFHNIVGIHDIKAGSKVDRGRELIGKVDAPRAQTILIGDTDHDLEVGKALGIDVILVEHGHQCPTRLHVLHDRVLKLF